MLQRVIWFCVGKNAFQNWSGFLKLGIPSTALLCLEWWGFEILSLEAAAFGQTQLAAHVTMMNLLLMMFFVSYGVGKAGSSLVGNSVGEANKHNIAIYVKIVILVNLIFFIITAIPMLLFRKTIAAVFTNDANVVQILSILIPIACLQKVFDSLQCIQCRILIAFGKPTITTIGNFVLIML